MVRWGLGAGILLILISVLPVKAQSPLETIKNVKSLPINGVRAIETEQGTFFASENGRFIWKGPIFDMWSRSEIKNIGDVDSAASRIDLKKIGVDFSQLAVLTFGQGSQEEMLFVSPTCTHCRTLLDQAGNLAKDYRFTVILLPLNKKDMDLARQLVCLGDQDRALKALFSRNYEGIPKGNCPLTPLQKNLVTARVLGITSVPYLVRHDGLIHAGAMKDLAGWLAAGKSQGEGGK